MLPTITMWPSPERSRAGRNARVTRAVPRTFSSYIRRHASRSASATGSRPNAPPALFTSRRTSGSLATNASTEAGSVTSRATARATPPSAPMAAATRSRRSIRRAPATTSNPCRARARAVASPMPLEAPVTTATFGGAISVMAAGALGRPHARGQFDQHLPADRAVLVQQPQEHRTVDPERPAVGAGDDGGGPRSAVQHRHLAEVRAGPERRPLAPGHRQRDRAFQDQVEV